jgi:predicted tellurium resistance membrane protein TerC
MIFIKLLEKFPRFEVSAYLLVIVIGAKLLIDWGFNSPQQERINFHNPGHAAFWVFWLLMLGCFCIGFWRPKRNEAKG